jgi:predicted transcriptional regulator
MMMELLGSHIIGSIAVATYVLMGILCLRFRGESSPTIVIIIASIPAYSIYPICIDSLNLIDYSATFFFGAMSFLFFWGGLYKSISVRILCDLNSKNEKSLSVNYIYEKYLLTESFKGRLEILVTNNLLTLEKDSTYRLTNKGRAFVQRVGLLQKIYKINFSG